MTGNAMWQFGWSDDLMIGDAAIDAQHRTFFVEADQIRAALTSEEPKDRILDFCRAFLANLRVHFHDEEQLMLRIGFAAIKDHQLEHSRLLAEPEAACTEIENTGCVIDCLLTTRALSDALVEHIATRDAEIGIVLRSRTPT